jgi:hypothetical protein
MVQTNRDKNNIITARTFDLLVPASEQSINFNPWHRIRENLLGKLTTFFHEIDLRRR